MVDELDRLFRAVRFGGEIDNREACDAIRAHVATLEADLSRAVTLLHMTDNQDARHPDVAAFLDEYEGRDG